MKMTSVNWALMLGFLLLCVSSVAGAQTVDDEIIVIRNVTLPTSDNADEGITINIQIKDGVLDIITEDSISGEEIDRKFNAQEGPIIGPMEIGDAANFLILSPDVDPISAILDTRTHARFVIVQGTIVKNTLPLITGTTVEERRAESQGWLSYTPPPRISRTTDVNREDWNRFNSKYVNGVFAAAVVLDRTYWLDQDDRSERQVGDLDDSSGGEIRGFRLGGVGTLNFTKPWVWTIFGATHAFDKGFDQSESDDFSFFDLRLDIPLFRNATFSIGKQKEPISMERIISMIDLPQQERAAVSDALLPSRNIGLVVAGNAFGGRVTLAGGVFNNFLDKDEPNSKSDNATQYVGRATWVPYMSDDESTLLHLGFGLRHSDLEEGGATSTEPEFNKAPDFLVVEPFSGKESDTLQFEASFRTGPFWLHSEYVSTDIDAPALGNPTVDGYHATFSWISSGEMRPYNKGNGTFRGIPISRNVNQKGWGAWEFSTRFSHSDLTDGLISGGEMDIWSAGVNWWLSPLMNVNMNYRYITLDKAGVVGHSQGINTRVLLMLQ
jgi:phosphate-selective porin OprO/OprP